MDTATMGDRKNPSPKQVLDGNDMNTDLFQLIGYVHSHGVTTGKDGLFDSSHMRELGEEFYRKYRSTEAKSPKRILNNVHQIKALLHDFRDTKKKLSEKSEKLAIHEHYMGIIQKLDRRLDGLCGDHSSWLEEQVGDIACSMEMEAQEYLNNPESFSDIEDDWTAKGNGTGAIQGKN